MKLRRVIEYEAATAEELDRHLASTLMSQIKPGEEIKPGQVLPGVGRLFAGPAAPRVTIRFVSEERGERVPAEPSAALRREGAGPW